jgi:hypothetical protein
MKNETAVAASGIDQDSILFHDRNTSSYSPEIMTFSISSRWDSEEATLASLTAIQFAFQSLMLRLERIKARTPDGVAKLDMVRPPRTL